MLRRTTVCLLLLSALIGQALADSDKGKHTALLKGIYQITHEAACTSSDQGFSDPPSLQALGNGGAVIDHATGTIMFDGRGNATEILHGISIVPQPVAALTPQPVSTTPSPVGTFALTCRYTYSGNTDKSFILSGSCTGTIPAGPFAGQTIDVSPVGGLGQLSESGTMFTISSVDPVQQTVMLTNGPQSSQTKRLCGASAVGIRVHTHGMIQPLGKQDD